MNRNEVRRAICIGSAISAFWLGWCNGGTLQSDEPIDSSNFQQVMIFQNGRTLSGKISRSPNGYVLEHRGGRLVVPFDEVRVIGESLTDAYHRLQESFADPTATTHYELAKWCWTHQLREEARAELVMALDRDASHEEARDFLERIDEQRAAARKKPSPFVPEVRMIRGIELPEVESLAGLSRETAARYSTRIQPLLMNKCANASCHGPKSDTGFHLDMIRGTGPGHRMYSERNLAQVMDFLDLTHPERSELLKAGQGNHGGLNRAIFYGPAGERQRELLKDWVTAVARERAAAQKEQDRPTSVVKRKSADSPQIDESEPMGESEPETSDRVRTASLNTDAGTEIAAEDDPDLVDAFDPQIFNRKHHGQGGEKPPRRTKSPVPNPLSEPFP